MNDKLKEEIRKTLGILKNGGVILYPTDTIWGLGCDATNPEAVKRIYDIKKRADNKSMLVLLDDAGKIASYADVPDIALDLIEVADKPTTIIYPGAKRLAPNLIAEDGTIGIRITREEFTRSLIFRYNKPIGQYSASSRIRSDTDKASACKVGTAIRGLPAPKHTPFAIDTPMRNPVYDPGPILIATASRQWASM